MSKITMEFDAKDMTVCQAFYYAMEASKAGKISVARGVPQHCFHTSFHNNVHVTCHLSRAGIEHFIIRKGAYQ